MDYFSNYFNSIYKNKFRNGIFNLNSLILSKSKVLDVIEAREDNGVNNIIDIIRQETKSLQINNILIVGAGSGKMGNEIIKEFSKAKIFELDKNKAVINRLKRKAVSNDKRIPVQGDVQNMLFKKNSIDLVIAYGVARYVADKSKMLSEIKRVLCPNGIAIISEARCKSPISEIKKYAIENGANFKFCTKNKVVLTRLSYFYFLITEQNKNSVLKAELQKRQALVGDSSIYNTALCCAGTYLGNVYSLIIKVYEK